MSEKYIPSNAEKDKAEGMMTPEQKQLSEERLKNFLELRQELKATIDELKETLSEAEPLFGKILASFINKKVTGPIEKHIERLDKLLEEK